jgi:hypothetical protein
MMTLLRWCRNRRPCMVYIPLSKAANNHVIPT